MILCGEGGFKAYLLFFGLTTRLGQGIVGRHGVIEHLLTRRVIFPVEPFGDKGRWSFEGFRFLGLLGLTLKGHGEHELLEQNRVSLNDGEWVLVSIIHR